MLPIIQAAARSRRTIVFEYGKKTDGSFETTVEVEPYTTRIGGEGMRLYGWEVGVGVEKSYFIDKMFNIRMGRRSFYPRYPIEI